MGKAIKRTFFHMVLTFFSIINLIEIFLDSQKYTLCKLNPPRWILALSVVVTLGWPCDWCSRSKFVQLKMRQTCGVFYDLILPLVILICGFGTFMMLLDETETFKNCEALKFHYGSYIFYLVAVLVVQLLKGAICVMDYQDWPNKEDRWKSFVWFVTRDRFQERSGSACSTQISEKDMPEIESGNGTAIEIEMGINSSVQRNVNVDNNIERSGSGSGNGNTVDMRIRVNITNNGRIRPAQHFRTIVLDELIEEAISYNNNNHIQTL